MGLISERYHRSLDFDGVKPRIRRFENDDRHIAHADRGVEREDLQQWLEEAGSWHGRCDREGDGREARRDRHRITRGCVSGGLDGAWGTEELGQGAGPEAWRRAEGILPPAARTLR